MQDFHPPLPQFLELDKVEAASHQSNHRIITFRDQLAVALEMISAKADGRSMSYFTPTLHSA